MFRLLIRTTPPKPYDVEGRAIMVTFLNDGSVLVFCDDGVHRILSQAGMIEAWEELWTLTARCDDEAWEWERVAS